MPRPTFKKSIVWTFFDLDANKKNASCKLCKKSYVNHGNTSNLKEHLKRLHPIQLQTEEDERSGTMRTSNIQPSTSTPCEVMSISYVNADTLTQATGAKHRRQLRLCATVNEKDLTDEKITRLDEAVIKMIIKDFQPLSVVEDSGFCNLIKELNPKYKLPSRKYISEKLLPETYLTVKEKLRATLHEIEFFAVTSDYWKGINNKTFLSLTCHCIYHNKLTSTNLATKEVSEAHTATNTASAIKNICIDWEILNKIVTIVTDNAANMKKAVVEDLKKYHHPCVAHTLNITVCDAINANEDLVLILAKCRSLVTHFKHSSVSAYKLKTKQIELNHQELKLKQFIPTRWNSIYIMIERLLVIKQPLTLALSELDRAPENLTGLEWAILRDCLPILKPALELTELLSGEKYVTMSIVVPLIRGLQHSLQTNIPETVVGTSLKKSLCDMVIRRLSQLEANRIVAKAAFLDPRFKKAGFGTETNALNAQQWIVEELCNLINENSDANTVAENYTVEQNTSEAQSNTLLWAFFDNKIAQQQRHSTPTASAHVMVKQYLDTKLINRDLDPLKYWEDHAKIFPGLYKMAMKYLCIPATSVPSERLFSKAGYILSDRRSRLSANKLDQLIFLHNNLEF